MEDRGADIARRLGERRIVVALHRFAGKRLSLGVDVYNIFNSDAATAYDQTYTATRLADGSWVADNPATPAVEVNTWNNITQLVTPRFMRLSMTLDF